MTPDQFRDAALSQVEAVEGGHMGQTDFRVGGKIFATMNPGKDVCALRLTPQEQETALSLAGQAARPAAGSWGRQGWTQFTLSQADAGLVTPLIASAWTARAPKKLLR